MRTGPTVRMPMTLSVLATCVGLLLFTASSALGAGMDLYWNECPPLGSMNRSFACNTNAGANVMVASFDPPAGITKLVASSAVIDLRSASSPLPSWWHLQPGGCRDGSLSVSFSPPAPFSCADYWSAGATGGFTYTVGFGGDPTSARIVVSFGMPEALAGPVTPGTEYQAFRLTLDNSTSVGTEACTGCNDPTCIILNELTLYQPSGLGDYRICNPLNGNFIMWQGGAIGGGGCPGADYQYPCSTPVLDRTWGQIKGLYR